MLWIYLFEASQVFEKGITYLQPPFVKVILFEWEAFYTWTNQLFEKNRVIFTLTCYLLKAHFLRFNGNEIPLSGAKKCLTAVGAGSYIDLKEWNYLNSWFSYASESLTAYKQAFCFGDEEKSLWEALFHSLPRRRFFHTKEQPLPLLGEGRRDEALGISACVCSDVLSTHVNRKWNFCSLEPCL